MAPLERNLQNLGHQPKFFNSLIIIKARFPCRSLLHYAYTFCSKGRKEVTMDGLTMVIFWLNLLVI